MIAHALIHKLLGPAGSYKEMEDDGDVEFASDALKSPVSALIEKAAKAFKRKHAALTKERTQLKEKVKTFLEGKSLVELRTMLLHPDLLRLVGTDEKKGYKSKVEALIKESPIVFLKTFQKINVECGEFKQVSCF